jgi:hypothetical protein
MSVRTFNFTGRRRIKREHAKVIVRGGDDGQPPTFDVVIDLGTYKLPESALVFVEGYRFTSFQRFAFGTVGVLTTPEHRELAEFGSGEGVLFRVKVVEPPSGNGSTAPVAARILAHADRISPDHEGRRKSLLPVLPGDFRDEVWRLEMDDSSGPALFISKHLARDWNVVVRGDEFMSLVAPEILRRILIEALREGIPEADTWQDKWVLTLPTSGGHADCIR